MNNTAAVILAGGEGKRMDILCQTRPKPALPFAGRFRVIDFSLSNCINSHISNIAVLTDYQRSYMADYLNRWRLTNAGFINFNVLEPRGGSYRGTADAVYQNLDYFYRSKADNALILAGDHIYKCDYRKMLAFHQESQADVTVGVIPVPIEQATRFGTVTTDAAGRITEFLEKSPMPHSNLASMGIYIFNRNILTERLVADADNPVSRHDFGYSVLPSIVKVDRVFAYRFNGYWRDIGTIDAYYEANMELTKDRRNYTPTGKSPILTLRQRLPPPCTGKQASIKNSIISPGCVIRGHIENSVLSPGVWVDEEAVVRNSVIMGNGYIGSYTIVDRSILDEGVNVGEYCHIGFDSRLSVSSPEITVLGKGVTIPADTVIERGRKVSPYAKPLDFVANTAPDGGDAPSYAMSGFQIQEVGVSEL